MGRLKNIILGLTLLSSNAKAQEETVNLEHELAQRMICNKNPDIYFRDMIETNLYRTISSDKRGRKVVASFFDKYPFKQIGEEDSFVFVVHMPDSKTYITQDKGVNGFSRPGINRREEEAMDKSTLVSYFLGSNYWTKEEFERTKVEYEKQLAGSYENIIKQLPNTCPLM